MKTDIELERFVEVTCNALLENCCDEEPEVPSKILKACADMFFGIFGKQISENFLKTYELRTDEVAMTGYSIPVIIMLKTLGSENTDIFISWLKANLRE